MNENEYEKIIMEDRVRLQNPYAHVGGDGNFTALFTEIDDVPPINLDKIRSPEIVGHQVSFKEIEQIAKKLQNEIWKERRHLLENEALDDLFVVLNPKVAFEAVGYDFKVADSLAHLGQDGGRFEVAGIIDKSAMIAGISSQFSLPEQNFTAAHELGHAVLHNAVGMHRDRALSGRGISGPRERKEVEADKFASYFLMPEKLVRAEFKKRFLSEQFVISEETSFALSGNSQDALRSECTDLRRLARKLADSNHYQPGRFFDSLTRRFKVSTEAMAIRLEELQLLRF